MRRVLAQTGVELKLTLRRGESVLLALGIPILLLVFFSTVDVLPTGTPDPVDFLAPGVLALAIMSTAMVGLGIATGFERQYGVLKRLGSTPLGRTALLTAKTLAILAVEVLQVVVLVAVALLLGWRPAGGSLGAAALAMLAATVGFAGIGLAMAGSMRGEMVLAAANGLYLVLLLLGGMVVPVDELPGPLRTLAELLPAAALSDALHSSFAGMAVPGRAWVVLVGWAIVAPALAARTFRWE
ncbi:MAG: ABC transporter permease [Acidimicrobiales bacterium]